MTSPHREAQLNALWQAHRKHINPLWEGEGATIPKEREDLRSYYGMYLDALDNAGLLNTGPVEPIKRSGFTDPVFEDMVKWIFYAASEMSLKKSEKEQDNAIAENVVDHVLRIASRHGRQDDHEKDLAYQIAMRVVERYAIAPAELAQMCDEKIDRSGVLLGLIRELKTLSRQETSRGKS